MRKLTTIAALLIAASLFAGTTTTRTTTDEATARSSVSFATAMVIARSRHGNATASATSRAMRT